MNILYLCEEYPPGKNGGIGTMVNVLGRELVKQGHKVFVAGLYPLGYGQADYEEANGVEIWRLRYNADIGLVKGSYSFLDKLFLKLYKYTGLRHFDNLASTKYLFNFIRSIIQQYDIDLIEMPDWNNFLYNSLTTIHVPQFTVPLIIKLNGSKIYFSKEMKAPVNNSILKSESSLFKRADAITSVSFYTAQKTKEIFNIAKEITILHNAIEIPPDFKRQSVKGNVIFTGALIKKKGILSLLQAWNLVNKKFPLANLNIYGKGPVDKLKKLLNKNSISSVFFHNHVSRDILLEELANAGVAVFPSYSEGFSFAPLEAMAFGCPVIYSLRSSGPELITDNENGLLIDPDDIDAIANAIILLIGNKNLRDRVSDAGRKTVLEKYNITISAQQHISFYNKIINDQINKKK